VWFGSSLTASGDDVPAPGMRTVPSAATPMSGNRPPNADRARPISSRVRATVDHHGVPALGDGHDLVPQHLGHGLELLLAHAVGAADQDDDRPVRTQPGAVERGRDLVGADDPDAGRLDVAGLVVQWCSSLPRRSDDRPTHLPSAPVDLRRREYQGCDA
jgi:hypothetical protein